MQPETVNRQPLLDDAENNSGAITYNGTSAIYTFKVNKQNITINLISEEPSSCCGCCPDLFAEEGAVNINIRKPTIRVDADGMVSVNGKTLECNDPRIISVT